MPVWRCPHCGTPQAETSRCWVCQRSTTSCGTCRHFRRGIAGGLGLCGLDPRRLALRGTEMRACWIARGAADDVPVGDGIAAETATTRLAGDAGPTGTRTFVPVDEPDRPSPSAALPVAPVRPAATPERGAWSLWGDLEA